MLASVNLLRGLGVPTAPSQDQLRLPLSRGETFDPIPPPLPSAPKRPCSAAAVMGLHKRVVHPPDISVAFSPNSTTSIAETTTTELKAPDREQTYASTEPRLEQSRLPTFVHDLISICFSGFVARRISHCPKWIQILAFILALVFAVGLAAGRVDEAFNGLGHGLKWLRPSKGDAAKLKSPLDPSWKPSYEIKPAE